MRLELDHLPFAPGATVGLYGHEHEQKARTAAPPGVPALETAVVAADSSLVFTGLEPAADYFIAGQVGGVWRWVRARTDPSRSAFFGVADPEDEPVVVDVPADQTGRAFVVRKGGVDLFWIDADGVLQLGGIAAGILPSGGDARWPADTNRSRVVFVNGITGSDAGDGRTWATAKKTIQAAANLLSGMGGEIHLAQAQYNEEVVLNSTSSSGIRIVGRGGPGNKRPIISPPTDSASALRVIGAAQCGLEDVILQGHGQGTTYTGTLLYLSGALQFVGRRVALSNLAGTGLDTTTYGGTGLRFGDTSEGCRFEDFEPSALHIGCLIDNEGATSELINWRPSNCEIEIMDAGNGGGCMIRNWKSVSGGQYAHRGGTDDPGHYTVDLQGTGYTLIDCDWSESHFINHRLGGEHNQVYGLEIAPSSTQYVTGNYNKFNAVELQGFWIDNGDFNDYDELWVHLGTCQINGPNSRVGIAHEQRPISGSFKRKATQDQVDAARVLTLARTSSAPGDSIPSVFLPARWFVAADLAQSDGSAVAAWKDRSVAYGTGNTTSGSSEIDNAVAATGAFTVGQPISGPGVPAGTVVMDVSGPTLTISQNATASASGVTLVQGRGTLTQATGANQPTYKTGIVNGLPVVRLDGTNDSLLGSAAVAYKEAIIVAFYMGATFSGFSGLLTSPTSGTPNDIVVVGNSGTANLLNDTRIATDYHLSGAAHAEASMTGPMSAAFGIMAISNPAGWNSIMQLGADRDNAGRYWAGDVAEILLFTEVLSDANRRLVEAALGAKYAITVV